jgi:hypothetical protein
LLVLDGADQRRTLLMYGAPAPQQPRCVDARLLPWSGRSGTTFGDPAAAAKGDTSEATQFKKSAGDFSRNDSGGGAPDIGATVRGRRPLPASRQQRGVPDGP